MKAAVANGARKFAFRAIKAAAFSIRLAATAWLVVGPAASAAQEYPSKPVRIISPGAGGSGDFSARLLAQGLTEALGQQVIVDNRSAIIAIESGARAAPDGYTLLFYGSGLWTLPFLRSVSYDPVRDFMPISLVGSAPSMVAVHPSLPVKTIKDLIALAKAKPGQLNFSSAQAGSVSHLAAELFKTMAKVNLVNVPYKSTGSAVASVVAGEVLLTFAALDTVAAHTKAGRLRAVAVMSAQPTALAPGIPTVSASGLPGYEVVTRQVLWAPAHTPEPLIRRLNTETVRYLSSENAKERFFKGGMEVFPSTPEQVSAIVKAEMQKWGTLIKQLGIRDE